MFELLDFSLWFVFSLWPTLSSVWNQTKLQEEWKNSPPLPFEREFLMDCFNPTIFQLPLKRQKQQLLCHLLVCHQRACRLWWPLIPCSAVSVSEKWNCNTQWGSMHHHWATPPPLFLKLGYDRMNVNVNGRSGWWLLKFEEHEQPQCEILELRFCCDGNNL